MIKVTREIELPDIPQGWKLAEKTPEVGTKFIFLQYTDSDGFQWCTKESSWARQSIFFPGTPILIPDVDEFIPEVDEFKAALEQWPLQDGWVAVDEDVTVFWYHDKPDVLCEDDHGGWCNTPSASNKEYVDMSDAQKGLNLPALNFTGDWRDSLYRIVGGKATHVPQEVEEADPQTIEVDVSQKTNQVFMVIQIRGHRRTFELQGVFSTEEKAIDACRSSKYAYRPFDLDAEAPDETVETDDWVYPLLESDEKTIEVGDTVRILESARDHEWFSKPMESTIGKTGTVTSVGRGKASDTRYVFIKGQRREWYYRVQDLELVKKGKQ